MAEAKQDIDTSTGLDPSLFFVGIGSSAGGLEAASSLVQNLPPDANAVYVLAQHMSPTHKSLLTTLISRETPLPVVELNGTTKPVANTIFITPPNSDVILEDGMLKLVEPSGHSASPKPSADRLFKSMTEEAGERTVGVVLSGTGSDGSYGIKAIREAGGITIAQDIATAKYDGMPASAAETGCIDLTLSPEQIGQHLTKILAQPRDFDQLRRLNERPSKLSDIFQILLARTSVDFRDYKEATVTRRINRRMAALDINDYDDYISFCRTSVTEVDALFRDLLISVTRFFRDKTQFDQLRGEFEHMVKDRDVGHLRLWVAGCATGEEAYSIAIMLAEALGGLDQLRKSRVQIFATDIDDRALEVARRGVYPITAAADIPDDLLETYFTIHDGRIEVVPELKAITLFSLHNIFHDPPFLNLDFVSLRNVLIYFNTALQGRVLHRMHYALNHHGLLFLGTSETVGNMETLFETRAGSEKIYSKRRMGQNSVPAFDTGNTSFGRWTPTPSLPRPGQAPIPQVSPHGTFDALARVVAANGFIVTRGGEMVRIIGDISSFTQMTENAPLWIGVRNLRRPLRDDIASLYTTALKSKARRAGRWQSLEGEEATEVRAVCYPLPSTDYGEDHVLVAIETRATEVQVTNVEDLSRDEQRDYIRQMEFEISQTREALQQTVEELQTSNEELQSINEEMQSTNEELQATNEELETSNEELQSTNEELITVNEELQVNSAELQRVSTELVATLEVVPFPVLVIDQALIVRRASQSAMTQFKINDLPPTGVHLSQCALPENSAQLAAVCNEVFRLREEQVLQFQADGIDKRLTVTPFRNQTDEVLGVVATLIDASAHD
ncbi:chemotaxis protein CheB [Gymnodinialimonas ulvae]|uniref:chemotaxis protein CheB n=1 Tax=Gymnodinialimonas ulvae TaxID=3126504 RepID=UPI0030A26DED